MPGERFAPGKTATKIVDLNGPYHDREHAAEIRTWRSAKALDAHAGSDILAPPAWKGAPTAASRFTSQ